MARLCKSFHTYMGLHGGPGDGGSHHHSNALDHTQAHNENAGEENKSEGFVDILSSCEPTERSFKSLLGNPSVSNARSYTSVQMSSGQNSLAGNWPWPLKCEGVHCCTECLGSESSDEKEDCTTSAYGYVESSPSSSIETEEQQELDDDDYKGEAAAKDGGSRRGHGHVGAKNGEGFPPPLSSMARNGQPSVFLKPLRKDGRFLLQEVEVPRYESLHAWRQDGRLRLQLIVQSDQGRFPLPVSHQYSANRAIPQGPDSHSLVATSTSTSSSPSTPSVADRPTDNDTQICSLSPRKRSSTWGGWRRQKWGASLDNERVHGECFKRGFRVDAMLSVFTVKPLVGRRCGKNSKYMTSMWKLPCVTT